MFGHRDPLVMFQCSGTRNWWTRGRGCPADRTREPFRKLAKGAMPWDLPDYFTTKPIIFKQSISGSDAGDAKLLLR